MDIDITQLKSKEIVKILQLYPQGHLETKFERVFWCSDYSEPESRENPSGTPYLPGVPATRPRENEFNGAMKRMSDTLGSMMGPARILKK